MRNLAGNQDCDRIIERELKRAKIEAVYGPYPRRGEVPSRIMGKLGKVWFERAWYYWIASGVIFPLDLAKKLYADPIGRDDIRVNGNAARPNPEDEPTYGMGKPLIFSYHIDSEAGLRIFADALRD